MALNSIKGNKETLCPTLRPRKYHLYYFQKHFGESLAKQFEDEPLAMMFTLDNPKLSQFTAFSTANDDVGRNYLNDQIKQILLENEKHRLKM